MGKGIQSAILTFSRQGLLNIPLLILMNIIFGLYGMIWTQLVVEVIMLPVSPVSYTHLGSSITHLGLPNRCTDILTIDKNFISIAFTLQANISPLG